MKIRPYIDLAINLLTLNFVPSRLRLPCFIMMGIAAGLALTVAHISRASSYLGHSPETCMNCHVMTDAYISWSHSSHAKVTVCTDCHLPQDNLVKSLLFKSMDGMKHSAVFIAAREPQVLELSSMAAPVVNKNCLRCHETQVSSLNPAMNNEQRCWSCHSDLPHGKARSLSSAPATMRPRLPDIKKILPEDMKIGERPVRPLHNGE